MLQYRDRLVGRNLDLAWIRAQIDRGAPLVALFGPPGVGKTRLAVEAVRAVSSDYLATDFVELRSSHDADDVAASLLAVIAPDAERTGRVREAALEALLARGRAVIVLDDLPEAAVPMLSAWAAALGPNPTVTFLVTSRTHLIVPEGAGRRVEPLACPRADEPLESSPAAMLLFDRMGRGASSPEEQGALREILSAVDGLPLAIELLARRIALSGATALQAQTLELRSLTTPTSQAESDGSLEDRFDASWMLLDETERTILAHTCVFRGGFTVEALAFVVDTNLGHVANVLATARIRSLVRVAGSVTSSPPRFDIYAIMSDYFGRKLADLGLRDTAERRHRTYFASLSRRYESTIDTDLSESLKYDGPNMEQALELTLRDDEVTTDTVTLTSAMALLPTTGQTLRRRLALLDRVLLERGASTDGRTMARLHFARGTLLQYLEEYAAAPYDLHRALHFATTSDDKMLAARILVVLSYADAGGDHDAISGLEQALRLAREVGDLRTEVQARYMLANAYRGQGALAEALDVLGGAIQLGSQLDRSERAAVNSIAASLHLARGDAARARASVAVAVEAATASESPYAVAYALLVAGFEQFVSGALDDASKHLRSSARQSSEQGRSESEACARVVLGMIALEEGRSQDAIAEFGFASGVYAGASDRAWSALSIGLLRIARAVVEGRAPELGDLGEVAPQGSAIVPMLTLLVEGLTTPNLRRAGGELVPEGPGALEANLVWASAKRILGRRQDKGSTAARALIVHVDGRWFRAPGADVVRCGSRRAIRRLLVALADARRDRPGTALAIDELRSAGWPDERMDDESARNRLKQSMAVLRRLGLGELLLRSDGGYLLDPQIRLSISDDANGARCE